MNDTINLVYIDDRIDPTITSYFVDDFVSELAEIDFAEIDFNNQAEYEKLIENEIVKKSDVIIIDSRLFENGHVISDKFSGEEFKIILKKIFPYKEVIVITQNEIDEGSGVISKFNSKGNNHVEYYNTNWKPVIEKAVRDILVFRNLSKKLVVNPNVEKVLVEQIIDSLDGMSEYQRLTTNDIDKLIGAFEELKGKYND